MRKGLGFVAAVTVLFSVGAARAADDATPTVKTTVPFGQLFASSWNTAAGTTMEAVKDGTKWTDVSLAPTGDRPNKVIEVMKDGVAGNNYMTYYVFPFRMEYNGRPMTAAGWGAVWRPIDGMVESEHTYFRVYVRAYPHKGFSYANGHFIQDFHWVSPGSGREMEGSQNVYWGIQYVEKDTWRPYITSLRKEESKDPRFNKWTWNASRDFQMEKWYRFEGHIRWLEHQRVSRAVWDMRVYDDKGELFKTNKDWTQSGVDLDQFYKEGQYFLLEGRDPTWMMAFNGPYIDKPSEDLLAGRVKARSHDICAFEIRNDRWCGPVKGDVTPDAEAPKLSLVKPFTGNTFQADADKVTLEGTASDNTSLLDVRWLSSTGLSGQATGLSDWKAEISLSPGQNIITLIATDKYLNSTQVQLTVTAKTAAPAK